MRDEFNDEDMIIRRMQDEKDELKARIEKLEKLVEELLEEGHYLNLANKLKLDDGHSDRCWKAFVKKAERMLGNE